MRGGWLTTRQWWAGQDSNLQPDRYERFDGDAAH